jgi:hypothetical protein
LARESGSLAIAKPIGPPAQRDQSNKKAQQVYRAPDYRAGALLVSASGASSSD